MTPRVTESQKRTIACPRCDARFGKACRGSRIPGANTFGGGWGGPPDLDRAHAERRAAFLECDALYSDRAVKRAQLVETMRALEAARTLEGGTVKIITIAVGKLGDALSAYEATGDHNHNGKPIATGAPCPGGDCIVSKARALLASEYATVNGRELAPLDFCNGCHEQHFACTCG